MKAQSSVIEVYSAQGCKYCALAKAKLRSMGLPFVDIDVSSDPHKRAAVAERAGGRTSVPQIFVGDAHVGGCDDLLLDIASGRFALRLASAGISKPNSPSQIPLSRGATDDDECQLDITPLAGILNHHGSAEGSGIISDIVSNLQSRVLALYDEHVRGDGAVDFEGMRRGRALREYILAAGALRREGALEEVARLSESARTALFINLYNALVLHASLAVPRPFDPPSRAAFFSGATGARYSLGGHAFSLDDMEHGVLRGSPEGDGRSFTAGDPRRAVTIPREAFDPRVHFALNCGAKSCPPIKLFAEENLEEALALAAQAFCEGEVRVDEGARRVTLSKIFLWYGKDFHPEGAGRPLLTRIASYMPASGGGGGGGGGGAALRRALEASGPDGPGVEFADYDWSLHAAA